MDTHIIQKKFATNLCPFISIDGPKDAYKWRDIDLIDLNTA